MRWLNIRIGSVSGIGIYLHWTFQLLIIGVFAFYYFYDDGGLTAAAFGSVAILAIFACVLLHEIGHALTAKRFNVPTRHITIYPIGGIARLERIPANPMKEFWIAIMGPAVNVAIAAVLAAVVLIFGLSFAPSTLLDPAENPIATLMWINIALVVFNMLPAFPMDGGRVLRALLAMNRDYADATQTAASIGQGMAILFGLFGILILNPVLLFIALFVYIGAQQESQQAMFRALSEGVPVRQAMMTRFQTLHPDTTLDEAVDQLLAGSEHDFPVVDDDGKLIGILRRKKLIQSLTDLGWEGRVGDIAESVSQTIDADAMLEDALMELQQAGDSMVPVVRNGELVGVLTLENVGELMMISSALRGRSGPRAIGSGTEQGRSGRQIAPPSSS